MYTVRIAMREPSAAARNAALLDALIIVSMDWTARQMIFNYLKNTREKAILSRRHIIRTSLAFAGRIVVRSALIACALAHERC
jgi:hypothetical protein